MKGLVDPQEGHWTEIESRLSGGFEIHLKFQGKFVHINVNSEYISQNPLRKYKTLCIIVSDYEHVAISFFKTTLSDKQQKFNVVYA